LQSRIVKQSSVIACGHLFCGRRPRQEAGQNVTNVDFLSRERQNWFDVFCWNGVNAPAAFGGPSSLQTWARYPEAIEPPETLDIRAARDRSPSSFRRNSAPAWNSMARNPPPESAMPMPGSSEWPSQLKPLACSVTPLGELGRGWLMTVFSDGRGTKGRHLSMSTQMAA